MRKLYVVFSILLAMVFSGNAQNTGLNGAVTYKNNFNTPMDDSTVVYLLQNNVVMYTDTVDSNGLYEFINIVPGNYVLKANSTKKWGGGNSLDALLCIRHFVGLPPLLTGVNLLAADANASGGTPSSVDGMAIIRRFVGALTNFLPASDWVSTITSLTIAENETTTQDIFMLCRGDVNGSFVPF